MISNVTLIQGSLIFNLNVLMMEYKILSMDSFFYINTKSYLKNIDIYITFSSIISENDERTQHDSFCAFSVWLDRAQMKNSCGMASSSRKKEK